MSRGEEREAGYVRKVQEDTRRYVQGLLRENETLRTLLAKMESEKLALEEQILLVRHELDARRKEQLALQRQLAEIEADNQRFSQEYVEIEQQNSNLANLYVTSYRLHGTLNKEEVLTAIQEVVVNLIGSEEMAVFELDDRNGRLSLVTSFGVESDAYREVRLGVGLIGEAVESGEPFFAESDDGARERDELTACIPLKVDGRVTGAIAVFRLLPQKAGLEALDHELFELLANHAATALYCANLHARVESESTTEMAK